MNAVLIAIVAYVAVQVVFGLVVARRVQTEEDYLVAGRRLGPWLATFTVFATWFGAETCIGAAGAAYAHGLSGTRADPFGYATCLLLMGAVFAGALWRSGALTIADLVRSRYGATAERIAVLLVVPSSLLWAAAQIRAFGQILAASSDLDVTFAITLAAAVVLIYTTAGGLLADAWSDLVQGIVLIVGLLLLAVATLPDIGSHATPDVLSAERLDLFRTRTESWWVTLEIWAVPILGSVMAQELVSRVIASRSAGLARRACLLGGTIYLCLGSIPVILGLYGPAIVPSLEQPDQILVRTAAAVLPVAAYALFAGALVSAILSTVDSALLVVGSLVAHNIVLPLRGRTSARTKLAVNRIAVACAAVVAYVLAMSAAGVYDLVVEASSVGTAGVFVVVTSALYGRRAGPWSASSCLVVGFLVYVTAAYVIAAKTPFLASLAAALLVFELVAAVERRRTGV